MWHNHWDRNTIIHPKNLGLYLQTVLVLVQVENLKNKAVDQNVIEINI